MLTSFAVLIAYSLAEDRVRATLALRLIQLRRRDESGQLCVTRTIRICRRVPPFRFSARPRGADDLAVWLTAAWAGLFSPTPERSFQWWSDLAGECLENAIFALILYVIFRQFNSAARSGLRTLDIAFHRRNRRGKPEKILKKLFVFLKPRHNHSGTTTIFPPLRASQPAEPVFTSEVESGEPDTPIVPGDRLVPCDFSHY